MPRGLPCPHHAHTYTVPIPAIDQRILNPACQKIFVFPILIFFDRIKAKCLLDFLAPSVLIRNSEMATWKRIVACSVGGAGCQSQSSPGIPCWFSCHGAVVGAPWPSVGASWQRWMRRRATGDPASPGLLPRRGKPLFKIVVGDFIFLTKYVWTSRMLYKWHCIGISRHQRYRVFFFTGPPLKITSFSR